MTCSQHRRTADVTLSAPRGVAPSWAVRNSDSGNLHPAARPSPRTAPNLSLLTRPFSSASMPGQFVWDELAMARISLQVFRFDSLIHNSGSVLYNMQNTRISTKRLNSRLTPRINENIIPSFMQRKYSFLRQVPVVTIRTANLTCNKATFCPHNVFIGFIWIWEQTAIISLYNTYWLVFITNTESVYCVVRTGSLNMACFFPHLTAKRRPDTPVSFHYTF